MVSVRVARRHGPDGSAHPALPTRRRPVAANGHSPGPHSGVYRHDDAGVRPGPVTKGASIYPAVQNLMLAARALGLGTVLTTLHTQYEDEIKTFLHIPASVETAALIPVGYPAEDVRFGGARRRPLSEVVFHDRWH